MKETPDNSKCRALEILLTPGFIAGLALLLLNDFYLKQVYGNFLTGKLSDLAGLFTFSLFLSALFPTRLLLVHATTAVAFVFWKTPMADGLINAWNSLGVISVARTIDYSDYLALIVLPLSFAYFSIASEASGSGLHGIRQAGAYLLLVVAMFAFGATSSSTDRFLSVHETYLVRESRVDIEGILLKDQRIKDLVPRVTRTVPSNGANIKLEEPLYYFDFKLEEKTCDSPETRMSFMLKERGDHTELAAINVKFECGDYRSTANFNALDKSYIEQARVLFERDILSQLTPINANDKTPRP
jgi:hypothetical protein